MPSIIETDFNFVNPAAPRLPDWDVVIGGPASTWLVPIDTKCTLVSGAAEAVADRKALGPGAAQSNAGRRPLWLEDALSGRPTLLFDGASDLLVGGDVAPIDHDLTFAALVTPASVSQSNNRYIVYAGSTAGYAAIYQTSDGRFVMYVGVSGAQALAISPAGFVVADQTYLLIGSYEHATQTVRLTVDSTVYAGVGGTVASITSGIVHFGARSDADFNWAGQIADALVLPSVMHNDLDLMKLYRGYIRGRYGLSL